MLTQPSVRFRFRIRAWVVREKAKSSSWSGASKRLPKDISLCSQPLPSALPFQLSFSWSSRLSISLNCNPTSKPNSNPRAKDIGFRYAVLGHMVQSRGHAMPDDCTSPLSSNSFICILRSMIRRLKGTGVNTYSEGRIWALDLMKTENSLALG